MFKEPKKRVKKLPRLHLEVGKEPRKALEELCAEWNVNFTEFVIYSILTQHDNRDLINAIHDKTGYNAKEIMELGYKHVYKYYFGIQPPNNNKQG